MADSIDPTIAALVFAEQAKKLYRELLVYRLFAQLLKSNGFEETVEEILDDARRSPDVQKDADAYDAAIDSRVPPSAAGRMEEAILKALAALPSTGLPN